MGQKEVTRECNIAITLFTKNTKTQTVKTPCLPKTVYQKVLIKSQ